jgi:hypothetical protein
MSIDNIKPCGGLRDKWDWEMGEPYIDNSLGGRIQIPRNYFDCGTYFFDGTFNVVKFPKGMNIYHGSFRLADNVVGFPVGIPYYNPNSPNVTVNHFLAIGSDESIEELVSAHIPITAGWYGDINVAKSYSMGNRENNPEKLCGDKCVFAYKLKKDIIMLLLDDDFNISKILQTNSLPSELKSSLEFMFSLQGKKDSYIISQDKVNSIVYPDKKRLSMYEPDGKFSKLACEHIIKKLNYSGYCANNQTVNKSAEIHVRSGRGFHLEFIFCNAFKWLERDLMNIHDWQNQLVIYNSNVVNPLIRTYYDQLNLYETTNINFHSGNLLEHSVWTLLWAEFILNRDGEFNRLLIPPNIINNFDNIKNVIAFAAFIHDIGKMAYNKDKTIAYNNLRKKFIYYDVKDHMIYGAEYINSGVFPLYDENSKHVANININELFNVFNVPLRYKELIIMIIRLHWDFGNILKIYNVELQRNSDPKKIDAVIGGVVNDYLNNIYTIMKPKDIESFRICVSSLLIVSIADNLATQPYGVNRINNKKIIPGSSGALSLNKHSTFFPFITNMSKNYKGWNLPVISNLYTRGIELSNKIYEYSSEFYESKII